MGLVTGNGANGSLRCDLTVTNEIASSGRAVTGASHFRLTRNCHAGSSTPTRSTASMSLVVSSAVANDQSGEGPLQLSRFA